MLLSCLESAGNYSHTMEQNFKNDLFSRVAKELGVGRKIYSPLYRPQSNGRIEGFHKFLKSCLAKHISRHREWDDIIPITTASYNWLPNQHSKESCSLSCLVEMH